jgi:hypothetical protein
LAFEQALAAGDKICLVAGNVDDNWSGKVCSAKKYKAENPPGPVTANCQRGMIRCNPDYYGKDLCVPGETESLKTATAQCNGKDPDLTNFIEKNNGQADFNDVKKMVAKMQAECEAIGSKRGQFSNQMEACEALQARIERLKNICTKQTSDTKATKETKDTASGVLNCPIADPEECKHLEKYEGCSYSEVTCQDKKVQYCSSCDEKKFNKTDIVGTKAVSCVLKSADDKPAKPDDGKKPDAQKPEEEGFFAGLWKTIKGFWTDNKSWLGPTLGLFGMMWFGYYVNKSNQSQQFGQQYNALYGVQPAAPVYVAPLTTTNPVLNPGAPVGAAR